MSKEKPLWQTDFIILLRWILFIPIGFVLTAVLQVIPLHLAGLLSANLPEPSLLTIVGAVIAVPILIVLGWVWMLGVLVIPYINCGFIAPNYRAPAIIYGMLFCLFEGIFLISILAGGTSSVFLFYHLVFSVISVGGIVMLYKQIELSRLIRWMQRGLGFLADVRMMMSRKDSSRRPV